MARSSINTLINNIGQLGISPLSWSNKLIENPNKLNLKILNTLFPTFVPFNAPHKLVLEEVHQDFVRVRLPYKKLNLNHLKSLHACALATAGEFGAGFLILKNFGIDRYRLILANLEIEYLYQAKEDVYGFAEFQTHPEEERRRVKEELMSSKKSCLTLKSTIKDGSQREIAIVRPTFQLKEWSSVKTKVH